MYVFMLLMAIGIGLTVITEEGTWPVSGPG